MARVGVALWHMEPVIWAIRQGTLAGCKGRCLAELWRIGFVTWDALLLVGLLLIRW